MTSNQKQLCQLRNKTLQHFSLPSTTEYTSRNLEIRTEISKEGVIPFIFYLISDRRQTPFLSYTNGLQSTPYFVQEDSEPSVRESTPLTQLSGGIQEESLPNHWHLTFYQVVEEFMSIGQ